MVYKKIKKVTKKLAKKSIKMGDKLNSGLDNYFKQDRIKTKSIFGSLKC